MSFQEQMAAAKRLAILQVLEQGAGYSMNHQIMASALEQLRAYSLTDDQVKAEFQWLCDLGLLSIETVGGYTLAKLTEGGLAVAQGRRRVPGIARPGPG